MFFLCLLFLRLFKVDCHTQPYEVVSAQEQPKNLGLPLIQLFSTASYSDLFQSSEPQGELWVGLRAGIKTGFDLVQRRTVFPTYIVIKYGI